jgi:polysaccharide export outer membrane protein
MKNILGSPWLLALLFLCSCQSTKEAIYFDGIKNEDLVKQAEDLDPPIAKNDILSISVSSLNPEVSAVFNMPNVSGTAAYTTSGAAGPSTGYLVSMDGNIQFPMLGTIKVQGLTKKQLAAELVNQLNEKKLVLDPIINVRHLNYHVTVLGEVARPAVIAVPSEKINLLEAIGLAGDLTIFAKRNNVLLIREEGGKRMTRRINLNATEVLTSPLYQLQSGDIVYVEPNKTKLNSASEGRQVLPIIISTLSVAAIALDRILR